MIFNGVFCKQTSTGLSFGITEKPKLTEEEMREMLLNFDPKCFDVNALVLSFFCDHVLSKDFMVQLMENWIDDYTREHCIEHEVMRALKVVKTSDGKEIPRKDVPCNELVNCITYLRCHLLKFINK